ncbi:MAG: MarR family transcriptional regulator [Mesorhizobium sp.]|nr:MarR family transcriptional regulator [Mesorhizobium sp. M4B.F.Ca.ET.058.02.1.1]RVD41144.1 MarR family transcriptional regulator [Mesorhizobium sp. M4A.F.Ca.ET.020.02.1.1]RWC20608.1 MAG: MarR family transcriptional regulator [Mesorhizobium sp.]RWC40758.1 MAG: MarR family transcriptional regulator [Mesorhizobium sp.]RWD07409.1 MAG: MarR family transcriptional regulator [Mesorhizobium sp.]
MKKSAIGRKAPASSTCTPRSCSPPARAIDRADERAVQLSQSEVMAMRHLVLHASATPSQIAGATGLQRTNVSPVLRDLETKGLIERHVDPQDRRGVSVHRTRRGAENYAL